MDFDSDDHDATSKFTRSLRAGSLGTMPAFDTNISRRADSAISGATNATRPRWLSDSAESRARHLTATISRRSQLLFNCWFGGASRRRRRPAGAVMVGGTGIEPVTYAMSTRRSTAELTARKRTKTEPSGPWS